MKLPRVWVHPGDSSFDIRIEHFRGMPGDTLIFRRDTAAVRLFRDKLHGAAPDEIFRRFEDLGPGVVFRSMELGGRSIAGAEFTDLDPGMKTYFGTDRGLLTLRVAPETPAARAGLRAGDIVVKANNQTVERVADLRGLLFSQPETLKIEVLRKGETKTLEIQTRRKGSED
jgi:membrane-associated protease RseP (regulator of RpoE activity)